MHLGFDGIRIENVLDPGHELLGSVLGKTPAGVIVCHQIQERLGIRSERGFQDHVYLAPALGTGQTHQRLVVLHLQQQKRQQKFRENPAKIFHNYGRSQSRSRSGFKSRQTKISKMSKRICASIVLSMTSRR